MQQLWRIFQILKYYMPNDGSLSGPKLVGVLPGSRPSGSGPVSVPGVLPHNKVTTGPIGDSRTKKKKKRKAIWLIFYTCRFCSRPPSITSTAVYARDQSTILRSYNSNRVLNVLYFFFLAILNVQNIDVCIEKRPESKRTRLYWRTANTIPFCFIGFVWRFTAGPG